MSVPQRGRIVWVEIPDPQGRNPKCRPAIIVSANPSIIVADPDCEIHVVGITSQVDTVSGEDGVSLPWHRDRRQGRTGLTTPSVAVFSWLERVRIRDIQDFAGTVPLQQMVMILDAIRFRLPAPPAGSP